jgi:hypothetical protein
MILVDQLGQQAGWFYASGEASVKLSKIVKWAAVAFVVWWAITQPTKAAHLVDHIGTLLTATLNDLSHFVTTLTK